VNKAIICLALLSTAPILWGYFSQEITKILDWITLGRNRE